MRCEDVRELLPAYSAGELRAPGELRQAGEVEVHLASCDGCSRELARYRETRYAVRSLRGLTEDPPPGLAQRVIAAAPPQRLRDDLRRFAREHPRAQVAAVSLGGAALGAAAIALLWWRSARRAVGEGEAVPTLIGGRASG